MPPVGSRGKAPGQGVRGRSRPEAEVFIFQSLIFDVHVILYTSNEYFSQCVR